MALSLPMDTQTAAVTNRSHLDNCPRCSSPIPLPLDNFCSQCRYPLRVDSEERAARLHAANLRRLRRRRG